METLLGKYRLVLLVTMTVFALSILSGLMLSTPDDSAANLERLWIL